MATDRRMIERVRRMVEDGERWFGASIAEREWHWGGVRPDGSKCIMAPFVGEAQIKAIRYLLGKVEGDGIRSGKAPETPRTGDPNRPAPGRNRRRKQPDGAG